jgi:hypothetical protein
VPAHCFSLSVNWYRFYAVVIAFETSRSSPAVDFAFIDLLTLLTGVPLRMRVRFQVFALRGMICPSRVDALECCGSCMAFVLLYLGSSIGWSFSIIASFAYADADQK